MNLIKTKTYSRNLALIFLAPFVVLIAKFNPNLAAYTAAAGTAFAIALLVWIFSEIGTYIIVKKHRGQKSDLLKTEFTISKLLESINKPPSLQVVKDDSRDKDNQSDEDDQSDENNSHCSSVPSSPSNN